MVSIAARMRRMHETLVNIRVGPGAIILPKTIQRIHLRFPKNANTGTRKFMLNELKRLKYHNPAVSMTVDHFTRSEKPTIGESTLSIHYAPTNAPQTSGSASSSAAPADVSTRDASNPSSRSPKGKVDTIDTTNLSQSKILEKLMAITKAQAVHVTDDDKETIKILREQRLRSEADAMLMDEVKAKKRREQELLEAARGEVAAAGV